MTTATLVRKCAGVGRVEFMAGVSGIEPPQWSAHASHAMSVRAYTLDVADDVLGNLLLIVASQREQLAALRDPAAWLFHIAQNAIIDHVRRCAAEARMLEQFAAAAKVDPAAVAEAETAPGLSACVAALIQPPEVLRLTDLEGMSRAQAAAQLGLSAPALKSRDRRGRAHLLHALTACCALERDRRSGVLDDQQRGPACSAC